MTTPGQHPLGIFESVPSPLVGKTGTYVPAGWDPSDPAFDFDSYSSEPGQLVLAPGMTVTVESAWDRDYIEMPEILLYVLVSETGMHTHIPRSSFKEAVL